MSESKPSDVCYTTDAALTDASSAKLATPLPIVTDTNTTLASVDMPSYSTSSVASASVAITAPTVTMMLPPTSSPIESIQIPAVSSTPQPSIAAKIEEHERVEEPRGRRMTDWGELRPRNRTPALAQNTTSQFAVAGTGQTSSGMSSRTSTPVAILNVPVTIAANNNTSKLADAFQRAWRSEEGTGTPSPLTIPVFELSLEHDPVPAAQPITASRVTVAAKVRNLASSSSLSGGSSNGGSGYLFPVGSNCSSASGSGLLNVTSGVSSSERRGSGGSVGGIGNACLPLAGGRGSDCGPSSGTYGGMDMGSNEMNSANTTIFSQGACRDERQHQGLNPAFSASSSATTVTSVAAAFSSAAAANSSTSAHHGHFNNHQHYHHQTHHHGSSSLSSTSFVPGQVSVSSHAPQPHPLSHSSSVLTAASFRPTSTSTSPTHQASGGTGPLGGQNSIRHPYAQRMRSINGGSAITGNSSGAVGTDTMGMGVGVRLPSTRTNTDGGYSCNASSLGGNGGNSSGSNSQGVSTNGSGQIHRKPSHTSGEGIAFYPGMHTSQGGSVV